MLHHGQARVPDRRRDTSPPVHGIAIGHRRRAYQIHAQEANHTAGVQPVTAGRLSRALEIFALQIWHHSWYAMESLEFNRSP
jgi:hypothetical protein